MKACNFSLLLLSSRTWGSESENQSWRKLGLHWLS